MLFREAFVLLGGRIVEREKGRFEILRAPSILKERDRLIGRSDPVLDRYARLEWNGDAMKFTTGRGVKY